MDLDEKSRERLTHLLEIQQSSADSSCLLDERRYIIWVNDAWLRFAKDNGGDEARCTPRERPILDVVIPGLRGFYDALYQRALEQQKPQELDYECSSADEYRRFRMRVIPLEELLLVTNHVVVAEPHVRDVRDAYEDRYRNDDGFIVQCAWCRTVARAEDPLTWDWVPGFLREPPPNISHGMCAGCLATYYIGPTVHSDRRDRSDT